MKRFIAGVLVCALTIWFTACTASNTIEQEKQAYPVSVNNITVVKKPEKVATLSVQITNLLEDLGYGERIVAVSEEELTQEESTESINSEESTESVSGETVSQSETAARVSIGTALSPDIEAIVTAAPDLVFTTAPMTKAQLDLLSNAGIQVMVMPAIDSLDALLTRYDAVIRVMDGAIEADTAGVALVEAIQNDVDAIVAKLPAEKKSFLAVCTLDPYVVTPDTLEGSLLSLIGTNAVTGTSYTADDLSAQADIVLAAAPLTADNLSQSETFASNETIKAGNVVEFDRDGMRSGTKEVVEALRSAAQAMYPDIDFSVNDIEIADSSEDSESSLASADE